MKLEFVNENNKYPTHTNTTDRETQQTQPDSVTEKTKPSCTSALLTDSNLEQTMASTC